MSLRTVEISVPQDVPFVVSIDGGIGPKVVEINQGPAGPNTVTGTTTTTLTGVLKGNGSVVGTATAGTDYLTPTGNGSGLTGLVSAQIEDASAGGTGVSGKLTKYGDDDLLIASEFHTQTVGGNRAEYGPEDISIVNSGFVRALSLDGNLTNSAIVKWASTSGYMAISPNPTGEITSITGNAATATALQTARAINGVNFDGTAPITIQVPVSTGITGLGSGVATMLATFSSANIRTACSDETGTGSLVFGTSPTLTTPTIAQINGGTAANDDLTLQGTSNATRTSSYVFLQPNGGITYVGAGTPIADSFLQLQLSTAGSNTQANIGINKNGAYGFLLGYINGTGGTTFTTTSIGYMRQVTTDPFGIVVNNTTLSSQWTSNGTVALGGSITNTTTLAGAHLIIDGTTGRATFNAPVKLRGYTFATLPTGSIGDKAYITDGAASPVFRANAAGGGSTVTEVFFNGTNWINS